MNAKVKDEMDLKELAISTLEIAEINLLMSFIEIKTENIFKQILPEENFHQEISKDNGEESLFQKIQRIALHYMGHTGQITIIRRALRHQPWGFVSGMKKDEREIYMEKWTKWWDENKLKFNLTNN